MAELCKLEITLACPPEKHIHSSMGSVFHGLLMDIVGSEVTAWLHDENSRPFSQCVYYDKERCVPIWRICTLSEDAYEYVLLPVANAVGKKLLLEHKDWHVELTGICTFFKTRYQDLMDEVFVNEDLPVGGKIDFLTTASFKRDGRYVVIPELYLIFQSLIARWNVFFEEGSISARGLERELEACCYITKYNLHTQSFSVNGSNIYGFCGNMNVRFSGNDMTRRLMQLIMLYADFAGIGIKTALGMGAVNYTDFSRPRRSL